MQKFTRPLTREIEVGGERIAVTLSEQGIAARIVGSRKPAWEIAWPAVVAHMTSPAAAPSADQLAQAVEHLKKGGPKPAAESTAAPTESAPAASPMHDHLTHPEAAAPPAPAHREQPTEAPRPEHTHGGQPMEQASQAIT